jgi:hypothetical protein
MEYLKYYFLSSDFKSHLENIYFLSGVALTISLIVTIIQLRQSKQIARLASKREAFRLAAERCEFFGANIIPKWSAHIKELETEGVNYLDLCKVIISENKISIDRTLATKTDFEKFASKSKTTINLLNALEGWAIFFVAGIADDRVGYLSCGKVYVEIVEKLMPAVMHTGAWKDDTYKALHGLFFRWRDRLNQERLLKQQKEIAKQLDLSKLKSKPAIGT